MHLYFVLNPVVLLMSLPPRRIGRNQAGQGKVGYNQVD